MYTNNQRHTDTGIPLELCVGRAHLFAHLILASTPDESMNVEREKKIARPMRVQLQKFDFVFLVFIVIYSLNKSTKLVDSGTLGLYLFRIFMSSHTSTSCDQVNVPVQKWEREKIGCRVR